MPDSVSVSFKIPGYDNFKMENESDFENMLCLGRSFRLDHIDVDVVSCGQARGVKRGGRLADGNDAHFMTAWK
ncbi:hypothetical protein ACSBR2_006337 [Camellia fascicularis]